MPLQNFKYVGLLFTLVLLPFLTKAAKTDTITFFNGEHIRCEIKTLAKGKLSVKTVNMSTVSIKLEKVAYIESPIVFEIIFSNHSRIFGKLSKGTKPGTATINYNNLEMSVDIMTIVSLNPIRQKFFHRIDGNFDLGFSFVKGTNNLQFNYDLKASYRIRKSKHQIQANSIISDNDASRTVKQEGGYGYTRFLQKDHFANFAVLWQENTELGIQNRILFLASYGISPVRNNLNVLAISAGFVSNTEQSQSDTLTTNLEGNLRIGYDLFSFSNPDIIIETYISPFISLTEKGRYRADSNLSVKWEVFNDFYFKTTFYYNFDSKPPTSSASAFDYGTTIGISYTF